MLNIEGGNKVTQGGREEGRWREGGKKGLGREDRQAERRGGKVGTVGSKK